MNTPPHTDKVRNYRRKMAQLNEVTAKVHDLQRELRTLEERIKNTQRSVTTYQTEMDAMLADLDLAKPANAGYSDRLQWFLAEVMRQNEQELSDERNMRMRQAVANG